MPSSPTTLLHAILGGGQVADIVLWRKKKLSAMLVGGVVVIWLLFEAVGYTFVTLLSHFCISLMLLLLAWHKLSTFFNWYYSIIDKISILCLVN
ncbi:Reticulon-like protein B9 [Camellia lanceoleosa]|uniref:Reticulon-like protein B9 n=1 Tax=Camellia lanceoleosa TaxID=1840588 RepID=A0ACC0IJ38_9ERIC|nr:Reticulon-like protein B9 [Camellia lanceoleosa]